MLILLVLLFYNCCKRTTLLRLFLYYTVVVWEQPHCFGTLLHFIPDLILHFMHGQSNVSTRHPLFVDTLSITTKYRCLLTSNISNELNLSIVAKVTYHPKSASSNYAGVTAWLTITENNCYIGSTLISRLFRH